MGITTAAALPLLHDEGHPFVVSSGGQKQGSSKRSWTNVEFATLAEADQWMREQNGPRKRDVYIKHATFNGAKDDKGRPLTKLANVVGSRCFFVDIDVVGEETQYDTMDAARAALQTALKALSELGVPTPNLLQLSGGGIQAAWIMTEPMQLQAWRVDNGVLYSLLEKAGLRMDYGAAAPERGVRLCGEGFYNWKTGKPRPTRILYERPRIPTEAMRQALAPHRLSVVPFATPLREQDEYSVEVEYVWHVSDSINDCNVLGASLASRGVDHNFHLWSALVALAARDSDEDQGRQWAHAFSDGHPDYDPAEVDRKFEDFRRGDGRHILCDRLRRYMPDSCAACAFNGKVKSPAGLPKAVREAVAKAAPPLPDERYYNGPIGLMRKVPEDDDVVVWFGYHVRDVVLHENPSGSHDQISFVVSTNNAAWQRKLTLDVSNLFDARSVRKVLAQYVTPVSEANGREVHGAMAAWITKLRADRKAQPSRSHLGWDGAEFVTAGMIFAPAGISTFVPDPMLVDFIPRGELEVYQRIANAVLSRDRRPEVHAHVATSFAAPLMRLTGVPGLVINFHSARSGLGKTTNTKLAAGVWGKPSRLLLGIDDTPAATAKQLGILCNLPAYYDDPRLDRRYAVDLLSRMIFRTTHGNDKRRLTQTSAMQETGSWQTLLTMSSNSSLLGSTGSRNARGDATAARVLEFGYTPIDPATKESAATVQLQVSRLDDNYGHIGQLYAQYLVANKAALEKALLEVNAKLLETAETEAGDVSGRMQAAAGAALIIGAMVAAKQGYLDIDPRLVREAVTKSMAAAKRLRSRTQGHVTPLDVLEQYLRSNEAHRIVTQDMPGSGKLLTVNHPHVARPVRYEVDTSAKRLIVDVDEFYEWMAANSYDPSSILAGLRERFEITNSALGVGTAFVTATKVCFAVPLQGRWSDMA